MPRFLVLGALWCAVLVVGCAEEVGREPIVFDADVHACLELLSSEMPEERSPVHRRWLEKHLIDPRLRRELWEQAELELSGEQVRQLELRTQIARDAMVARSWREPHVDALARPADADLRMFMDRHASRYETPLLVSYVHAWLRDPGQEAQAQALPVLASLRDTLVLGRTPEKISADDLEVSWERGLRITDAQPHACELREAAIDVPVTILAHGHAAILWVYEKTGGKLPPLDAVRDRVTADLEADAATLVRERLLSSYRDLKIALRMDGTDGTWGHAGGLRVDVALLAALQSIHPEFHFTPGASALAAMLETYLVWPRSRARQLREQHPEFVESPAPLLATLDGLVADRYLASLWSEWSYEQMTVSEAEIADYHASAERLVRPAVASVLLAILEGAEHADAARSALADLLASGDPGPDLKLVADGFAIVCEPRLDERAAPWVHSALVTRDPGEVVGPLPRPGDSRPVLIGLLDFVPAMRPPLSEVRHECETAVRSRKLAELQASLAAQVSERGLRLR